ncbi:AIPR family protein [Micromonospora sp. B006]|uniref:AIPR family protein n=1 Tax=Micromonospora sp. B006 TaxID=2201999 RepID=UPI00137574FB|nr:AIPR family protein [Micromonospora sp. B006]
MSRQDQALPGWLADYDAFSTHLDEQLIDETSHGKGLRFVSFALAVLPWNPATNGFDGFELNSRLSHDKGVDILTAANEIGQQLLVQSKFRMRRTEEIDAVISQFESYEAEFTAKQKPRQYTLFDVPGSIDATLPKYLIVTASKLDNLMRLYKDSHRSSRPFFDRLTDEGRITFVDGTEILRTLKSTYRKAFEVPAEFEIQAASEWLEYRTVRLGIVAGAELVRLYDTHGDGLFFENIRTFLGLGRNQERESVNRRIVKTVEEQPERMLERNNGITIRASRVRKTKAGALRLENASIVNGCQTTMCLVTRREVVGTEVLVPVKVVESDDLWEVARSANYQNRVRQIDLDLAKYLRPQLVQRAAARMGVSVQPDAAHGVNDLIATISSTQVTYEETKALYKGVFSTRPTNIFDNNYSSLLTAVLDVVYEHEEMSQEIFSALFVLSGVGQRGREEGARVYPESENRYFQRFRKPEYSAYITLLAAGVVNSMNLADRQSDPINEAGRILDFLRQARDCAEHRPTDFVEAYLMAYEVLSETGLGSITDESGDALISQDLHKKILSTPYDTYYKALRMRLQREKARRDRGGS